MRSGYQLHCAGPVPTSGRRVPNHVLRLKELDEAQGDDNDDDDLACHAQDGENNDARDSDTDGSDEEGSDDDDVAVPTNRAIISYNVWFRCTNDRSAKQNKECRQMLRDAAGLTPATLPPGRWQCDQCDRSYRYKDGLEEHVRNQHGPKSLKCGFCGKARGSYGQLKGHELGVHGEVLTADP